MSRTPRRVRWARGLAVALLLGLPALPAEAQKLPNLKAAPLYGAQDLVGGFAPDPVEIDMQAGGDGDASQVDASCVGSINFDAPDLSLNYRATVEALSIYVTAETDTTLVVRSPAGTWHCNDDAFGHNPGVTFDEPGSGLYLIWVGTFEGGLAEATLGISELGFPDEGDGTDPFTTPPLFGELALSRGFEPDPQSISVIAGGDADLTEVVQTIKDDLEADGFDAGIDGTCVGFVSLPQPDVRIRFTGDGGPLYIFAKSNTDTTLFVIAPDATFACNDDGDSSGAGTNPMVVFQSAQSGDYNIWVGTFEREEELPDAELFVSEIGFK